MTLAPDKHLARASKARQTALGSLQVELCSFPQGTNSDEETKTKNKQTNKTSPEADSTNAPQAESEA